MSSTGRTLKRPRLGHPLKLPSEVVEAAGAVAAAGAAEAAAEVAADAGAVADAEAVEACGGEAAAAACLGELAASARILLWPALLRKANAHL